MRDATLAEMYHTVTVDDLPSEDLRWIAEEIGMEATVKLLFGFGGLNIYIPKGIKRHIKKLYAQRHYDGRNVRRLAVKLDVAERTVYRWVKEGSHASG